MVNVLTTDHTDLVATAIEPYEMSTKRTFLNVLPTVRTSQNTASFVSTDRGSLASHGRYLAGQATVANGFQVCSIGNFYAKLMQLDGAKMA